MEQPTNLEQKNWEDKLRQEIAASIEGIDASQLTDADLSIFAGYKDGTLALGRFREYQNFFINVEDKTPSKIFCGWLADRLMTKEWQDKFFKPEEKK